MPWLHPVHGPGLDPRRMDSERTERERSASSITQIADEEVACEVHESVFVPKVCAWVLDDVRADVTRIGRRIGMVVYRDATPPP